MDLGDVLHAEPGFQEGRECGESAAVSQVDDHEQDYDDKSNVGNKRQGADGGAGYEYDDIDCCTVMHLVGDRGVSDTSQGIAYGSD